MISGVSIVMGGPLYRWMVFVRERENPDLKWMMKIGVPPWPHDVETTTRVIPGSRSMF